MMRFLTSAHPIGLESLNFIGCAEARSASFCNVNDAPPNVGTSYRATKLKISNYLYLHHEILDVLVLLIYALLALKGLIILDKLFHLEIL
jgi:hypothetical protein